MILLTFNSTNTLLAYAIRAKKIALGNQHKVWMPKAMYQDVIDQYLQHPIDHNFLRVSKHQRNFLYRYKAQI